MWWLYRGCTSGVKSMSPVDKSLNFVCHFIQHYSPAPCHKCFFHGNHVIYTCN